MANTTDSTSRLYNILSWGGTGAKNLGYYATVWPLKTLLNAGGYALGAPVGWGTEGFAKGVASQWGMTDKSLKERIKIAGQQSFLQKPQEGLLLIFQLLEVIVGPNSGKIPANDVLTSQKALKELVQKPEVFLGESSDPKAQKDLLQTIQEFSDKLEQKISQSGKEEDIFDLEEKDDVFDLSSFQGDAKKLWEMLSPVIQDQTGLIYKAWEEFTALLLKETKDANSQLYLLRDLLSPLFHNPPKEKIHSAIHKLNEIKESGDLQKQIFGIPLDSEEDTPEEVFQILLVLSSLEENLKEAFEGKASIDIKPLQTFYDYIKNNIQREEGQIKQVATQFLDLITDPNEGVLPKSIGMLDQEVEKLKKDMDSYFTQAPSPLVDLYTSLLNLLSPAVSKEELQMALRSLKEFQERSEAITGKELKEEELAPFAELYRSLSDFAKENDAEAFSVKEKDKIKVRQLLENLSGLIEERQGKAMQAMMKCKEEILHPEKGLLHQTMSQARKEATSIVGDLLKQAGEKLRSVHSALQSLQNGNISKEDFQRIHQLLKEFKSNPNHFIGRPWKENENAELKAFLNLTGAHLQQPVLSPAEKGLLKDHLLPQVKQYIQERQGVVFKGVDDLLETFDRKLDQTTQDLTKTAPETLIKGFEKLQAFKEALKKPSSITKEQIAKAQKVVNKFSKSHKEFFQFSTEDQQKEFLSKLAYFRYQLQHFNPSVSQDHFSLQEEITASPQKLKKELKGILQILESQINQQDGLISKTTKVAVSSAVKTATREFDSYVNQKVSEIKSFLPFGSSGLSTTPQDADEASFSQPLQEHSFPSSGNILSVFDSAKGFLSGMLGKLPQVMVQNALSWVNNMIMKFLDKALHWSETSNELTSSTQISVKSVINEVKRNLQDALNSGDLSTYLHAVSKSRQDLSQMHILVNGLEIPLGKFPKKASPIPAMTDLIDRNQRRGDVEEGIEINWRAKADENKKQLIQNISYFGTFQFANWICGADSQAENTFQNLLIKIGPTLRQIENEENPNNVELERLNETQVESIKKQQRDAFDKALSEHIWKRTDIGGIQKFFTWIAVRSHLISWIIEKTASRFLNNLVTRLRGDISEIQLQPLKPLSLAPIQNMTDFFSSHQKILEAFANDDSGGLRRDKFIKRKMDDPKFNHGYKGSELYQASGRVLVDQFLPGFSLTDPLKKASESLWVWSSSGDSTFIKVAKFFPAIACQAVLFAIRGPAEILNWGVNKIFNRITKTFVVNADLLKTLVKSTKNSLYKKSQYTPEIDQLLLDQLKEVWEILQSNQRDESIQDANPERTSLILKELVKNAFNTLDMRKYLTQNEMRNFLQNKDLSTRLRESFDELFMDDTVESIVRLLLVVYQSVINEKQLEKQMANAFEIANKSIIEAETVLSEEDKKRKESEYQQTEQLIEHYLDRILRFTVHKAIQKKVDELGLKHQEESDKYVNWIQSKLIGEYHFSDYLEQLAQAKISALKENNPNIFFNKLENIKELLDVIPEDQKKRFLQKIKIMEDLKPEENIENAVHECKLQLMQALERETQEGYYIDVQTKEFVQDEGLEKEILVEKRVPVHGILGSWLSKIDELELAEQQPRSSAVDIALGRFDLLERMRREFDSSLMRPWRLQEGEMEVNQNLGNTSKNQLKDLVSKITLRMKEFQSKFLPMHNNQGSIASILENQEHMLIIKQSFQYLLQQMPQDFNDDISLEHLKAQKEMLGTLLGKLRNSVAKTTELDQIVQILETLITPLDQAMKTYIHHNKARDSYNRLQALIPQIVQAKQQNQTQLFHQKISEAKQCLQQLPESEKRTLTNKLFIIENANNQDQLEAGRQQLETKIAEVIENTNITLLTHREWFQRKSREVDNAIENWNRIGQENLREATSQVDVEEIRQELILLAQDVYKLQKLAYIKLDIVDSTGFIELIEEHIFDTLKKKSESIRQMIQSPEILEGVLRYNVFLPLVEKYEEDRTK
ncbi:MAG: hypothetical protein Tsb0015_11890 [Simkaniaceae bacterium]